jgi:hypothetical protein
MFLRGSDTTRCMTRSGGAAPVKSAAWEATMSGIVLACVATGSVHPVAEKNEQASASTSVIFAARPERSDLSNM